MIKGAFIGFGEVNTPKDIIINKCKKASDALKLEGIELLEVYPVTDDYEEKDINKAIGILNEAKFDFLVLCVAGWIPSHAVIKITEQFRHIPMVLWGLCGWMENGRLITTADQAGTTALRKVMSDLGYTFKYVYDIMGKPSKIEKVTSYCHAAVAVNKLRQAKVGMMGYRDMNLYGTLYDGTSLKRTIGPEIETFEMLEVYQRYNKISYDAKHDVLQNYISKWKFLKQADTDVLLKGAGYFLALKDMIKERNYKSISLKDVDGMKKLLGFPPAMIFMLLSDHADVCTIPENDSLGCITQLMVKFTTGQSAAYLEFYEFMEDRVLAGVPDYVPSEIVDGTVTVIPAAFGELSQGILNVSKVKTGNITMCRLGYNGEEYIMHMVKGEAVEPVKWEEAGWTQPAPQLPGLEICLVNMEDFADKVLSQHYIISYGDHTEVITDLCKMLKIRLI